MRDSAQQLHLNRLQGTLLLSLHSQVNVCLCPAGPAIRRGSCARTNCTLLSHLSNVCLQLVQEFKLLLIVGRRLVFPAQSSAAVRADMTTQVQFRAADGTTAMRTVSLMFPANCRTIVRLMEAWYDARVSLSTLAGRHFCVHHGGRAAGRATLLQLVGGGLVGSYPTPHGPTLSGCAAVQPDVINNQGACTGYGLVMHQSNPPSSLHTSHLHTVHHKRGPDTI
jgi:hypothetical protein